MILDLLQVTPVSNAEIAFALGEDVVDPEMQAIAIDGAFVDSSSINGSGWSKFHHLRGPTGGYKIEDTALRAIELKQLQEIYTHVERKLKNGSWKVSRPSRNKGQWIDRNLRDPKKVNLYDVTSIQMP